jgi:peptidoglycan/LPS O-acetylase OafA/YrhL
LGVDEYGRSWWLLLCAPWLVLANASPFWEARTGNVVVRFIAERAYSLYLLHVEALALVKRGPDMPFWLTLLVVWVVALLASEVLYRCVERPGMQLREWFRSSQAKPTLPTNPIGPHTTVVVPPSSFNPVVPA